MVLPGVVKVKGLKKEIGKKEIFINVCEKLDVDPDVLLRNNKKRDRKYVVVRQVSMTLFHKYLGCTTVEAGAFFNKDHATVIHAVKTVRDLRDTDKDFRQLTNDLFKDVVL